MSYSVPYTSRLSWSSGTTPRRHATYAAYGLASSPLARDTRSMIRNSLSDSIYPDYNRRRPRLASRDELIDSVIHTRTPEYRRLPCSYRASSWEDRRLGAAGIDCDQVYPGIIVANGETVKNMDYLRSIGATHVLNTAERHVPVTADLYPSNNISYYGFHVDDHPASNISRHFSSTSWFIDDALRRGGKVVVNCAMGWSRSATVVAAYLMEKKGMSASEAIETLRRNRPIRPNPGFLRQLADYDNIFRKRLVWNA